MSLKCNGDKDVALLKLEAGKSLDLSCSQKAQQSGIQGAQWSAVIDEHTCEVCKKLDGKVISVDHPDFDKFQPPLHDGCRCIRIYIGKEETNVVFDWESPRVYAKEKGPEKNQHNVSLLKVLSSLFSRKGK